MWGVTPPQALHPRSRGDASVPRTEPRSLACCHRLQWGWKLFIVASAEESGLVIAVTFVKIPPECEGVVRGWVVKDGQTLEVLMTKQNPTNVSSHLNFRFCLRWFDKM